jgi:hypothetical protein
MRAVAIILSLVFASLLFAPTASAGPDCIQVYPWSKLCEGDVGGFLCAEHLCPTYAPPALPLPCDVKDCVRVDCIQAIPWSYLCSGNVEAFLAYYLHDVTPIVSA